MNYRSLINTTAYYGWVSIGLHWSMALALIGLYFLGDYMVTLDYYDTWYHKAPALHKSTGMVLGLVLVSRIFWNAMQPKPAPLETNFWLVLAGKTVHFSLYLLTLLLLVSGYLISTARGQGISVFGLLEFPALLGDNAERGELAGTVHATLATVFIITVALHSLAALIHHYIFKDRTLSRMLWVKSASPDQNSHENSSTLPKKPLNKHTMTLYQYPSKRRKR